MASTRSIIGTTRRFNEEVEVINPGKKFYHIVLNEEGNLEEQLAT